MKRGFRIIVIGLFLLVSQTWAAAADTRIGVLDMERFQQESKAFQKVSAQLKGKFDGLQKQLDKEKRELRKLEEDLQKRSMMLSLDAKEDKEYELEKKRRHYKYLYDEFVQDMKHAEMEATRRIGKEVEKVVGKIAKDGGFTIVLERRTMGLVYYNDAIDITDEVIKAYDRVKQ